MKFQQPNKKRSKHQQPHKRMIGGKSVKAGRGKEKQKAIINRQLKAGTREAMKRNYEVEYGDVTVKSDAPRKDQRGHETDDMVREV